MNKINKIICTVLFVTLCLGLCACGSTAKKDVVDDAPAGAAVSESSQEKISDNSKSEESLAEQAPEKTIEDTLKEADSLIAQKKYKDAMDVLTTDERYVADKQLGELYSRINEIEKLTKDEVKPEPDEKKPVKEIELTKENFWDYFEIKTLYGKDPFNRPYAYQDDIYLKEEYANKIAYDRDFEFAVSYIRYSSYENIYKIDPDTLEMTFLYTKNFYSGKSRGFDSVTNNRFNDARFLDYSVFDGTPVDYDTMWTVLANSVSGTVVSGGLYQNNDDPDDTYRAYFYDYEIDKVIGSILLYE